MMEIILITNFMIVLTINQVIQRQRSIQAMLQQVLFNQEQIQMSLSNIGDGEELDEAMYRIN